MNSSSISRLTVSHLLLWLVTAPLFLHAQASVQLSIPDQTFIPGSTGMVPVTLTSTESTVSGIQFDVEFDPAAWSFEVRTAQGSENAAKQLHTGVVQPNVKRILLIGSNQNQIPNGLIVEMVVTIAPGTSGSFPLKVLNAVGVDASGTPVSVTTRTGAIAVVAATPVRVDTIVNAASLSSGAISPGEVVVIQGSGFTSQTTVSVNGVPAPVLSTTGAQMTAVIPFAVSPNTVASVVVNGSSGTGTLNVPIIEAAPGIFSADASGSGQGAFLNEDLTINSSERPAKPGSVIAMYITGAGLTDPPSEDGMVNQSADSRLRLPLNAEMNGKEAAILYGGPAPGSVAGIAQVNVQVPDALSGAGAATIQLTVGTAKSQPGIFVFIK